MTKRKKSSKKTAIRCTAIDLNAMTESIGKADVTTETVTAAIKLAEYAFGILTNMVERKSHRAPRYAEALKGLTNAVTAAKPKEYTAAQKKVAKRQDTMAKNAKNAAAPEVDLAKMFKEDGWFNNSDNAAQPA